MRPSQTTREWGFEGAGGRIAISSARMNAGSPQDGIVADVAAEIRTGGRFTGACTVGFSAAELTRFHRQLGAMLTGGARHATFGDLGDAVGLTIDASEGRTRVSGFVGAGLATAVSFNDMEIDRGSLVRSYLVLDLICRELAPIPAGPPTCGPEPDQESADAGPPAA
jgi:hypothetical protein